MHTCEYEEVKCDDKNECTFDYCDTAYGGCMYSPVDDSFTIFNGDFETISSLQET